MNFLIYFKKKKMMNFHQFYHHLIHRLINLPKIQWQCLVLEFTYNTQQTDHLLKGEILKDAIEDKKPECWKIFICIAQDPYRINFTSRVIVWPDTSTGLALKMLAMSSTSRRAVAFAAIFISINSLSANGKCVISRTWKF